MTSEQTVGRVEDAASQILSRHDLVLEDAAVHERQGTTEVTLVVDLPEDRTGSADLDAVAEASREISELLDEDESILGPGPSLLEVTTPGAERTLTQPRHFRRSRGRLLTTTLAGAAGAGETSLRARLLAVAEDGTLTLHPEPGVDDRGRPRKLPAGTPEFLAVPLSDVVSARVEVEFTPPPDQAQLDELAARAAAAVPAGQTDPAAPEDGTTRPSSAADDSER
ncbi:ribosome assembly cofactor RimP [Brachybacterium halotolerans subsp. kimchii]|uniref:Ribosome maturation factor RimP n=1 Tax=Brachybacterium halotolerans TaxID=2795215 RepID=A0ABS1BEU9_9MICO|nr:ribosome assembly cofactor RimP [Brachybacterium halotolerans]MBK0332682.1 ribosome assembly cofactor RimP [Brachybacterium halotolerans]UEJ83711.1 ribosome assembly cofactor RimP [Brachybacterium halotolerans subsp. kimchii]